MSAKERLAAALRNLAFGDSQLTIAIEFRLRKFAANDIMRKTCYVMCEKLSPNFVRFSSTEKWKNIVDNFGNFGNFHII